MRAAPPLAAVFLGLRPNKVVLQSRQCPFSLVSVMPTVAAEHSLALLPPAQTSCNRTMPSLPVNSTMTRPPHPTPPVGRYQSDPYPPGLGRSRVVQLQTVLVATPDPSSRRWDLAPGNWCLSLPESALSPFYIVARAAALSATNGVPSASTLSKTTASLRASFTLALRIPDRAVNRATQRTLQQRATQDSVIPGSRDRKIPELMRRSDIAAIGSHCFRSI
jgi:hypothetical protein